MARPALVLLAAGESDRLGACKALVRLRERDPATPLALLLSAGASLSGAVPLVVTGADHDEIAAAVAAMGAEVELARNERWADGRTGGVRLAARLRPGHDLCLAPVDVPLVPESVFRALAEAWEAAGAPARGWLAPAVLLEGRRRHGHPVVVGRELLLETAGWPPARPLFELRRHAEPLLTVPVDAAEILDDLDTPEDLAALRRRLASR